MAENAPQSPADMLKAMLQPWHEAVNDPPKAQQEALHRLLQSYAQTEYGTQHGSAQIQTIDDYRRAFPIATYEDYKPLIERVMAGDVRLLLAEEPVGWAITRGTTKGESKFIPMTPSDLQMRIGLRISISDPFGGKKGNILTYHVEYRECVFSLIF